MTDTTTQIRRETRMQEMGVNRARANIARHEKKDGHADTPAGVQFCRHYLEPMAQAIRTFRDEALNTGKAGRKNTAASLMSGLDEYLLAYLTVRGVLAAGVRHYSLNSAAIQVSNAIEMEVLALSFKDKNMALYKAVMTKAKKRGLDPKRQAKAVRQANAHFKVVDEERLWTQGQRLHVGTKLIELCIERLGLVQAIFKSQGKNKRRHVLELRPDIVEWYRKTNEASLLSRPLFLPTAVPPQPWTGLTKGPYYTFGSKLITRSFRGHKEKLQQGDLSGVYRAVNGLQETPWRINTRVAEVMRYAWDNSLDLPGIPALNDEPVPARTPEVEAAEKGSEIRKEWRKMVRAIKDRNAKLRSQRFEMARAMDIVNQMGDEPFYFPHRLDFRGRMYAMTTSLNPQGADEMRGLLEFAEGVRLGERGDWWLGIHGANLFGNDKVDLYTRYSWALDHVGHVRQVVADPYTNRWWTEADKPWSFLAWCYEWAYAYQNPDYVSHLPIALDGSCNGIQHYSAMLRDPVGGAAVNLTPQAQPNDIYQRVADRVIDKLKVMVEEGGENAWIASGWLQFGINRKTTKRQVMVLPYGGTYKSCMDYTWEAVSDRLKSGTENPFGDDVKRASNVLAKLIWESISDVVVAARGAMDFLQACSRLASANNVTLDWETPSGFRAMQAYMDKKTGRIETQFNGMVLQLYYGEETTKVDRHRNASAIAPNFVHSMDAAALVLTVNAGLDEGITSWAMIHDSYGTHAGRTDDLARILREQFVGMYTADDWLARFRDRVIEILPDEAKGQVPELPAKGTLDLGLVLQSDYFFA